MCWPQGLAPSEQFSVFFFRPSDLLGKEACNLASLQVPLEPALGAQGPGHASHSPLLSDPPQHGPWCSRCGRLWAGAPRGHWMTPQSQNPDIYDSRSSAPAHRGTGRCFLLCQPRSRSFGQSLPALCSSHALLPTPVCPPPHWSQVFTQCIPSSMGHFPDPDDVCHLVPSFRHISDTSYKCPLISLGVPRPCL